MEELHFADTKVSDIRNHFTMSPRHIEDTSLHFLVSP